MAKSKKKNAKKSQTPDRSDGSNHSRRADFKSSPAVVHWKIVVDSVHGAILRAMEQLAALGTVKAAARDGNKDQDAPAEAVDKYSRRLGGVDRVENDHVEKIGHDEQEWTRKVEGLLHLVKCELLPQLEKAVEDGMEEARTIYEKNSSVFADKMEMMEKYMCQLELVECMCRSLTVHTSGDVLGSYMVILKAKPYLAFV